MSSGKTLKGIRRTIGTAQQGKAPLLSADIRRIVAAWREDPLVLVGFASGFGRSELARIIVTEVLDSICSAFHDWEFLAFRTNGAFSPYAARH